MSFVCTNVPYPDGSFANLLSCWNRIQSRDYEQITERPEKTLANLARIEEEQMRKERKLKERQGLYNTGNTITGNARSFRRPAMSADYLAAGGYDDDEGDVEEQAFERLDRERAAQKPRPKQAAAPKPKPAPKKKGPVSSDYLEYDEEEGSDMADEDEEEEDNSEMEDDEDDDGEVSGMGTLVGVPGNYVLTLFRVLCYCCSGH